MRILLALVMACSAALVIELVQDIELPSAVVGGFFLLAWWTLGQLSALKHA
jgi:hypothetical protein